MVSRFLGIELPLRIRKAMHLTRHHLRKKVCPHCQADTAQCPFEAMGPDAAWLSTIPGPVPWTRPHVFAALPGGDAATFMKLDTFHLCALGVGYYAAPSIIGLLAAEFKHFTPPDGKTDIESRLATAHRLFASFCQCLQQTPRDLKDFTKSNFHWPDRASYPMLSCKAGDTLLVMRFIEDYLSSTPLDLSTDPLLQISLDVASEFNKFQKLLYSSQSRVWWTTAEACLGLAALTKFLRAYEQAARQCLRRQLGVICSSLFCDFHFERTTGPQEELPCRACGMFSLFVFFA